ncbi:uncharacterized protein LOC132856807 isoform X2 [Tachysurus vachellii]|uniref:uncharacterized protein LOC132856807 isoform X2 n=1 Tax=Tachysurus vachellii TaxID=175792 RepID=UPI00296AE47D|nr:uncharacterized protein LOC132856807 isoform X2 [Tachysurus vachellii]
METAELCGDVKTESCITSDGGTSSSVGFIILVDEQKPIKKEEPEDEGGGTSSPVGCAMTTDQHTAGFQKKSIKEEEPEDDEFLYETDSSRPGGDDDDDGGDEHPWPHLSRIFSYQSRKRQSIMMSCKLCLPKNVEISAFHNSSSNLRKHVERKHPQKMKDYENCIAQRRKRKETPCSSNSSKQCRIDQVISGGAKQVPQSTVDKLVINFICEGLQPFSVVEQPAFKTLINTLQPGATVMSRPTVRLRIQEAAMHVKKAITARLSKVEFVSTTADCWSVRQGSYIGVTCHWIEEETLERKSVALACKRLRGHHTFDILASSLDEIHSQYHIRDKIVRTTTDSGSNFLKAFKVFGVPEETAADHETDDDTEDEEEAEYHDMFSILEADTGLEYHLPNHQRCACHLLNLVATTDASVAETQNATYRKLSRSAFSKCHALWNKSARSSTATDVVDAGCHLQFIRPNQTRWCSLYLAVERVVRIMKDQGEEAIRNVCGAFKLNMLNPAEIAFLAEYVAVMKPVTSALNVLQSENNTHMGCMLPTVFQLRKKLQRMEATSKLCLPLLQALQEGLDKRFGEMMKDPELIAAAILLPRFKTSWTSDTQIIETGLDYIRNYLRTFPIQESQRCEMSDEDDFFSSMKANPPDATGELQGYLACAPDSMDLLHTFPYVKKLSLRLNTGLPASAACKRLFSCAGQLFTAKRARIDCSNFENQLLIVRTANPTSSTSVRFMVLLFLSPIHLFLWGLLTEQHKLFRPV